ncbi:formylglycine-generating enzyme family protein [Sorangium cellulosum]|nr:SUMF1/EgtB/PvdO family nonheme iron enzyme [Sorangium cellulosum]
METDVDCGGTCAPCRVGQTCATPADCYSTRCEANTCAAADCANGEKDGSETDIDCGGGATPPRGDNPVCPACDNLEGCAEGTDCESLSCVSNRCLPPSCSDGVKNGEETDVDCGGLCTGCAPGAACSGSTDCSELVCLDEICLPPSCSDGVKNGSETDIDCGGAECGTRCPPGQRCSTSVDCKTGLCDTTNHVCACPASMVIAPVTGGGSYCIDAYEVTKQEYDRFVMANPVLAGLPSRCAGNTYPPTSGWPYTEGRVPVTYVDWCDAYTYCAYVGKHLCGKIGGGGSATAASSDHRESEWFNACSGQGVNDYPYGHEHAPSMCQDITADGISLKPGPPTPLPPVPVCEGGVSNLYNMSGNVAEWENSCDPDGACLVRGGSLISLNPPVMPPGETFAGWSAEEKEAKVGCSALERQDPTTHDPNIGFRCCL